MNQVMKPSKGKKSVIKQRGLRTAKIVVFIVLSLYAFSLVFPVIWAFLTSLKDQIEYSTYNVNGLPTQWLFSNYLEAFKILKVQTNIGETNMIGLFINSLWYSFGAALLGVLVSSMAAYVVAKYKFPGGKFFYSLVIVVMMIPIVGNLPSQYRVMTALGIINTPFYILAFASGMGFNFMVLYGYFKNLPWSYAEAAFIDGASHVRVFFKVMIPQAVPLFTALGALALITGWNDYMNPLLFLKDFPTLSSGLYIFRMQQQRVLNMPVLYAGILISAVPVVILFSVFSSKIMDISMGGGLKG